MKLAVGILLFCLVLLPISFGFSAEIYKWTDKNGKIIFSDSPPPPGVDGEIKKFEESQAKEKPKSKAVVPQARPDTPLPPATGTAIQKPQVDPALKEKPKAPADSPQPITASREKRPYESINVIMYMTVWWGYCRKAREDLKALNVNLVEYNVERDAARRTEMLSKSGGSRGVPLIDIEGIIIKGYSQTAIREAVEKRRSL